jgi:hypothetical protein
MKQNELKSIRIVSIIYGLLCLVAGANSLLGLGVFLLAFENNKGWKLLCELGIALYPLAIISGILYLKGAKKLKANKVNWKKPLLAGSILMILLSIANAILKTFSESDSLGTSGGFSIILGIVFYGIVSAVPIYLLLKLPKVNTTANN